MEDDSNLPPERENKSEFAGCAGVIGKVIIGVVVLFVAAVALVFGTCLLG